jgi:lipid-A-disaccharide synthase
MRQNKRIFIIAGEASGDILGTKLIEALRRQNSELAFCGVGGENMEATGLKSIFPMRDIALMGFAEVIPHTWRLLNRLRQTCEAIADFAPDVIITIDSPGFNVRVVEWVRRAYGDKIPCVHYVAPTVWAYKPHRALKFAKLFNHLLCILPFEPPYFKAHQMRADFVGHYIADDLVESDFRAWREGEPLELMLFPGSRVGEVQRMLPIFAEAINLMRPYFAEINVYIAAHSLASDALRLDYFRSPPKILYDKAEVAKAMQRSHLAITKTGTVTLEIARASLPMVACYRVNNLTAYMVRKMLKIPYVNLLNILQRQMNIPELLQDECTAENIATHAVTLIKNPAIGLQQFENNNAALMQLKNHNGILASDFAAQIICNNYLSN